MINIKFCCKQRRIIFFIVSDNGLHNCVIEMFFGRNFLSEYLNFIKLQNNTKYLFNFDEEK